jgi:hypothetical protein
MAPELNNIFGIIFEKVSSDYLKTFLLNAPEKVKIILKK